MTTTPVTTDDQPITVASAAEVVFLVPNAAKDDQLLALAKVLGLDKTVEFKSLKVARLNAPQRIVSSPSVAESAVTRVAGHVTNRTKIIAVGLATHPSTCLSDLARGITTHLGDGLTGLLQRDVPIAVYNLGNAALVTPSASVNVPAPAPTAGGFVESLFAGLLGGSTVPAQRQS